MSDRLVGLLMLALAVWYGWTATSFEQGFGDPVGPSAFPTLLAYPIGAMALFLIVRPDPDPVWPKFGPFMRQLVVLAALLAYPLLLEPLGFPLATAVATLAVARVLGATYLQATLAGIGIALTLYISFDRLLGLPLQMLPKV